MDTSETYIKMCEKAVEIQAHDFEYGDWYAPLESNNVHLIYPSDAWDIPYWQHHRIECIWIPRQDQLQEILLTANYSSGDIIECFVDFGAWLEDWDTIGKYKSGEQLWLAFVMKEKYNKVWNGEEWTGSE